MRYLFSKGKFDYYEKDYKFYRVCEDTTEEVSIEEDEALSEYY